MTTDYYIWPYYRLRISPTGVVLFSDSHYQKGKLLKFRLDGSGYQRVNLSNKTGKNVTYYIHDLVTREVLGPKPKGMTVNHIDGDKLNNHPDNLEYVTQAENIRHMYRLGLKKGKRCIRFI